MLFGRVINKYYLKYAFILIMGVLSLVAVDYAQLQIPKVYKILIAGVNGGMVEVGGNLVPFSLDVLLDNICAPILVIVAVMIVGRFLWRVCFFGASTKMCTDLRGKMFDKARMLSPQYYQVNKVGNMMSLFTNDLETITDCFGWGLMMFFDAIVLGSLSVANMIFVQPVLTLLCLIPMAILMVIGVILNKYMTIKWDERQESFSKISDFTQESFSGIAVIKAFVKEAKELLAFKKLNENNEKVNVEFTRLATILRISVGLFVESVVCVILGYGGYLVYNKTIAVESLLEFIGYFTAVVWPIMAVSELIDMHSRGKASLNRIGELLAAPIDVKDKDGAVDIGEVKGDIEFRKLTFAYPNSEREVLKDLSFKINAGENVGIVGKIGSGKTTVSDLILRAFNVPDGTVFIDGKDVNDVTIESLRRNCAYVPQDNFLFSDTIKNNISFSSAVKEEDVKYAAELAAVAGDIEGFTEGYETVLGERGVTVSGGQKQRISMARAFLKDAPILILDDSVSAVDTSTEESILAAIEKTRKGKTTILIAHRITTVKKMDKILFLDGGKLLAAGSHEEMLEICPEYAKMVELQRLEEKEGA